LQFDCTRLAEDFSQWKTSESESNFRFAEAPIWLHPSIAPISPDWAKKITGI
jgi:hypothetical protein